MFIFVSDFFKKDYAGGAELTLDVLINSIDLPKHQVNSANVTISMMEQHKDKIWVFGNYAHLKDSCLIHAVRNLDYYVVEFDYKYCKRRLEALCEKEEGACGCADTPYGKLRAVFTANSKATFWMSQGQLDVWSSRFSPLDSQNNIVLSSTFTDATLHRLETQDTTKKDDKWIILGSESWVKGKSESIQYAKDNNLDYELVWGFSHAEVLEKLAKSKGLIQLPNGHDTCPRMTIEAKLLDCELVINDFVQHKDEEWFNSDKADIVKYLMGRPKVFRDTIYSLESSRLPTTETLKTEDVHFSIVVPSYNNEQRIEETLKSIANQAYNNYKVYFIDDASTDNSRAVVENFVKQLPSDKRRKFDLQFNADNKKALHNIVSTISLANKDSVVVLLDGDDRLSTGGALVELARLYHDKDIWVTTGSYVESGTGRIVRSMQLPADAWGNLRKFREPSGHPNIFSHLRTFRKALFQNIEDTDLKEGGKYFPCTFDRALMYPMLEMAGPEHHRVIEKAMYVYNTQNPRSVHHVDRENQLRIEELIRNKKPYERLTACE